jgi:hypothetical protein
MPCCITTPERRGTPPRGMVISQRIKELPNPAKHVLRNKHVERQKTHLAVEVRHDDSNL